MAEPPTGPLVWKFPAGIDNRSREYALAEGSARTLTNLDVTRDGGLRCRAGVRQVVSGNCHSLYAPPRHAFALLVQDGQLCRLDAQETVTVLTAVAGPVCYALHNDEIFWSDGSAVGRVLADGTAGVWGLTVPPQPVCSVGSGSLTAGTYQVAMTAIHDSTGLESGAMEPASVTVPADGSITVTVPGGSGVTFALYMTPLYGERHELRQAARVAPGTTVNLSPQPGKLLETLLAVRPLPCQALVAFKGRLWAASGNVVWHTSERSPHWLFPADGYYQFESDVRMLGAAEDGLYVGLYDRVYFLQGNDPAKMTQRPVSWAGALPGGGADLPYELFPSQGGFPTRQCAWWDTDGFLCVGKPGGVVVRPSQERYAAGEATSGIGCYRAYQGLRQWVSVLDANDAVVGPLQAVDVAIGG